ncbi:MAG: MXAN_6640 family putative metalloprotease [Candidatus Eisenbacteria bacterium]
MKSLWISLAALVAVGLLTLVPSPCGGHDGSFLRVQSHTVDAPDGAASLLTSRLAIERARARGEITRTQEILYKAYSLHAPERLPAEYRGEAPEKCGTAVAQEIEETLPRLPEAVAEEIRSLRARPTCDTYYDTAHFRIHYDTSGDHMILNWPDTSYRDSIAVAVEKCRATEIGTLGFREPPNDGGDPDGGGGNGLYDIYLQDIPGYYGWCQGGYTVPATPRTDCSSHIVIDNDYAGFGYGDPADPMKVTVAHEYGHSCQFSMNYNADTWYMECTSVWVEDIVYDDINDYRFYLPYYLNYPYAAIEWQDGTGLRMYGSAVWNFFLEERFSASIVPDIWYRLELSSNDYTAFDYCLGLEGSSLEEAFGEYAVWNWFTGSRDDGLHYGEGAYWPLVPVQGTYSSYPVLGAGPIVAQRPDHLGWNFIHFTNTGGPLDALVLAYDGPDLAANANRAFVNKRTSGGAKSEHGEISLDAFGQGDVSVLEWDTLNLAAVVVANTSTNQNNMVYTIDADHTSPVAGSFYAHVADGSSVTLRWTLGYPEDIISLDVLRAVSSEGHYEVLNDEPIEPSTPGSYVDHDVRPGEELLYELRATLRDGSTDVVEPGTVTVRLEGVLGLALRPPAPNPFRDAATFEYTIPGDGSLVRLAVHDVSGRAVAVIEDGWLGRGRHIAVWDGTDGNGRQVASGVYFCTLEVPGAVVARKVMLLR